MPHIFLFRPTVGSRPSLDLFCKSLIAHRQRAEPGWDYPRHTTMKTVIKDIVARLEWPDATKQPIGEMMAARYIKARTSSEDRALLMDHINNETLRLYQQHPYLCEYTPDEVAQLILLGIIPAADDDPNAIKNRLQVLCVLDLL